MITYAPGEADRRRHKGLAVLRRRAPLGLVLLLATVGLAYVVGDARSDRYSAETVLIVPAVSAGRLPPGDPDAAIKLAKTYTAAIPLSRALLDGTAQKVGLRRSDLAAHLSITNDAGTSLVRVAYEGATPQVTVRVLSSVSNALVGTNPPLPVSAGTLRIVSQPDAVTRTAGGAGSVVPAGVVLGLLLALGAAAVLERATRHVDRPSELVRELEVPVTTWSQPSRSSAARLVRHWFPSQDDGPGLAALVGVGPLGASHSLDLAATLRTLLARPASGPGPSTSPAAVTTGEVRAVPVEAFGEVVDDAAAVVLVVPQGATASSVAKVVAALQVEDRPVSWAIFVPRSTPTHAEAPVPSVETASPQTPLERA